MLEPKKGILTFRAEGNNIRSSKDYSQKLHRPGISSLWINRDYYRPQG